MRVEPARPADLSQVEALLAAAGLPLDGAADAFGEGVVVREDDRIIGAAAVERYGANGLLRSVVVEPAARGTGVGRTVVSAAEDLARSKGIKELYLLTETAIDWFPRFGYESVDRPVAAAAVGESVEFSTVCTDTAVSMRKRLGA